MSEPIRPAIFRLLGGISVVLAVWGIIVLVTSLTVLRLADASGEQVPEAPPIHLAGFLYVVYGLQLGLEVLLFVTGLGLFAQKAWSRRAAIGYSILWCAVVTIAALVVTVDGSVTDVLFQYVRSILFPVALLVLVTRPVVAEALAASTPRRW